jgi:lysylphosphatidylglycerol synthetase-like protein (DUF2156 family)
METKTTSTVTKGLIISLIMIVFGLVLYFTGQYQNKGLGMIQYCILIGGIIWACINYAKQMNHNVTFGNVFAHGFKITALVIVIMVVYSFVSMKFIFPEMQDKIMEQSRAEMLQGGKLTDDQVDGYMTKMQKYFIPFMIGGIIIAFGIIGAIASLIGAAAAKKNPQAPFNQ